MGQRVKILTKGYQYGTFELNKYTFTDGISDQELSDADVDAIAAVLVVEAVDKDGNTEGSVGVASRLVDLAKGWRDSTEKGAVKDAANQVRQDVLKRGEEQVKVQMQKLKGKEELEELAALKGINGLRDYVTAAGLKAKAVKKEDLLDEIVAEQEEMEKQLLAKVKKEAESEYKKAAGIEEKKVKEKVAGDDESRNTSKSKE